MNTYFPKAPELQVSAWFNTDAQISLASLKGRIVLLHAFQILCPACISHGIPQAQRAGETFAQSDVAVVGLHTVFEQHDAMTPQALQAFIREQRLSFPIGVDRARPGESIPATMHAFQLQGTPSVVLIDRLGRIRLHHLGYIEDLRLGTMIGRLLAEPQT
jgi:peroxiredoxin